ncbi:MAG: hypothetical protein ACPL5F_01805 [Moorellaceae bacterium]
MANLTKLEQETIPLVKARLGKVGLKPVREQGEGCWYRVPRWALRMKLDSKTVKLANKKRKKK